MANVNGTVCTLIGRDDLSVSQREQFRMNAIKAGKDYAVRKGIATSHQELDARDFQNIIDAGAALEQWNTAALLVVGNNYSVFQAIAAPILAANKVAVFWGVSVEDVPSPVSRLLFRTGGAAGNILYNFDMERTINNLENVGYFSEPVVIGPTQPFAVQVTCRIATLVLARVQLFAEIIEPKGLTITGNP